MTRLPKNTNLAYYIIQYDRYNAYQNLRNKFCHAAPLDEEHQKHVFCCQGCQSRRGESSKLFFPVSPGLKYKLPVRPERKHHGTAPCQAVGNQIMHSDAMSATNYVNTVRGKVGSEIQEGATAGNTRPMRSATQLS